MTFITYNITKETGKRLYQYLSVGWKKKARQTTPYMSRCPEARHRIGGIGCTDSNAGQKALEGQCSLRTPLDIRQVKSSPKKKTLLQTCKLVNNDSAQKGDEVCKRYIQWFPVASEDVLTFYFQNFFVSFCFVLFFVCLFVCFLLWRLLVAYLHIDHYLERKNVKIISLWNDNICHLNHRTCVPDPLYIVVYNR